MSHARPITKKLHYHSSLISYSTQPGGLPQTLTALVTAINYIHNAHTLLLCKYTPLFAFISFVKF